MKEHKDDVSSTVDSTTSAEIVTERGKIEGIFGERDGEDMMVDVVSADMAVDEHGVTKVDFNGVMEEGPEKETGARDHVMEDVGVVEAGNDDMVVRRVKTVEKVEVVVSEEGVKESIEVVEEVTVASGLGCDDQKSGNGPVIGDSKMASEPSSKEAKAGGEEVVDGDHVMDEKAQKETEVLSFSKISESTEGHVVIEDDVNNQSSSIEVVNAGTCEDNVHVSGKNTEIQAGVDQTKKESFQSTIEATTNDSQKSGNGTQVGDFKRVVELDRVVTEETVERSTESVQEAADVDSVMSEKTGKDEILDPTKISVSVGRLTESVQEAVDVNCEMSEKTGKDETLDSTKILDSVERPTKSVQEAADVDCEMSEKTGKDEILDSTKIPDSVERPPEFVQEAADVDCVMSEKTGTDEILDPTKIPDPVERPTESVQEAADVYCVMSDKTGKDEILDSTKIPDSMTKVDEVITEEGLAGQDEAQDGVSKDQSSLCPDKPFLSSKIVNTGTCEGAAVHENAENLDQNAKVDQMNEERSSQATIDVGTHDASQSGKETEVGDSMMDDEPEIIKAEIDVNHVIDKGDETELGFTKDTLEQPVNSVQEVIDGDQDSSKIPHSSIMASLGLEEDDVVVVDEGLEGKSEAGDHVSVEPSLVDLDNQSILTEVVNVGTDEVDQKSEVDSTNKDKSSYATIKPDEVAARIKVDEATIVHKEPNHDVQVSTVGGILVEKYTEPEPATDKMTPGIADEVVETDKGVQTIKVEPATIGHDSSDIQVDQGLNANHSNQGTDVMTSHIRVPDSTIEVPTMGGQHGVLPANSQFSYEDAHMERGEDAGMDIDEVLGWKDEIPSVQEDNQKVDPTNLSNVEVQETEALEHTLEFEQWNKASISLQQSSYFHSPENEGEFSVSDLVWGKVRSHPWWPGQIFDPSDASEKAMKYHKKDCFLVAYFGDRTFGWNDSSVLKPFRENFSQIVEHMDSEAFNNAVHCALQEISRRVELGLTCSCIPLDINENIKYQIVENSGIKQEASRRHGVDKSASVNSFEPGMLVDYVRLLAKFPYDAGDKMELTMAKAQLSSYGRFKGHRQLAEFQLCGDLLEVEQVIKDETYSEDGTKKRKALDSISDGSEKRLTLQTETVTAKPSFKVGGYIQKVASQLTGPPEQVTGNSVSMQSSGPTQLGNQADMLSQLHLAAQDPMKGYGFMNTIIPFFNTHRATVLNNCSLISSNDDRKRKTSNENRPEEFEFDDVNDSYWTDRIIQNYQEENLLQENQNGGGVHQIVAYEQEKQPVKPTRRSNKKRFFSSNHEIEAKEQSELIERRQKNLATEVLLKFPEGIYFPSEIHLNKMFRRFGPLVESETEVDRQSGRARVVFKKCSDAEVAHSSAGKFNIFGSINVNYELNYTPLISYKPLPLPLAQDPTHAC